MDKLTEAFLKIIEQATTSIQAGITFLSTQIPDIIHQLLLWTIVKNSALILLFITISILIYKFITNLWKKYDNEIKQWKEKGSYWETKPDSDNVVWLSLFAIPTGLIFLVLSFINFLEILQIWIAPKIWLINYTTDLYKSIPK